MKRSTEEEVIAHIRERATLARDGKPHLAKDRHRKKFLVKVNHKKSAAP